MQLAPPVQEDFKVMSVLLAHKVPLVRLVLKVLLARKV